VLLVAATQLDRLASLLVLMHLLFLMAVQAAHRVLYLVALVFQVDLDQVVRALQQSDLLHRAAQAALQVMATQAAQDHRVQVRTLSVDLGDQAQLVAQVCRMFLAVMVVLDSIHGHHGLVQLQQV
jgi:hypothetical protein